MKFSIQLRARQAFAPVTLWLKRSATLFTLAGLGLGLGLAPAVAAKPGSRQPGVVITVKNDYGGSVRKRFGEVQQINRLGQRVEISGSSCMSSCTMYLGAKNVCVSPNTTFGFHGPSRFGSKLTQVEFDEWSRVISSHYPAPVRTWYMQNARHSTNSVKRVKGNQLIRLGIPSC